jgi:hypothetical protein
MNIILPNENNNENAPLLPDGKPKLRFEVKMRRDPSKGIQKAVFIDGELLDWEVDAQSLMEAMKMGPTYYRAVQRDIERHYVESVSEFIGRRVTADDIKEAIKTGWI